MKVLWLASWYPNIYEPVNGDFIQRHAKAVAAWMPIDVIHVLQTGKDKPLEDTVTETVNGNLRELIYSFSFKKTGLAAIDKIRYNLYYKKFYLNILRAYISKHGKPHLIHVHVPMKAGMVALQLKKKWGIPYIVSEQASHYEKAAPDSFYKRSFFFRYNTRKVFQQAACVTNVSATLGTAIQQLFSLRKVDTVHNLADKNVFFYKQTAPHEKFRWLHVSALNSQKNIEGIIEAFEVLVKQRQANCQLVIAGPFVQEHVLFVKGKGLEGHISFIGEIAHNDVAMQMQQANAFVLFSKHENFPCVVVEAFCCGLPVVASNVGGVAEAINESNGITVPSENVGALAEAMHVLMHRYGQYQQQQIAHAAIHQYSAEVIGKQFVEIYQRNMPG